MTVEHSQNGLTVVDRSGITVYLVAGTAVKLPLRTGPVGELLTAFAGRWHRQVEPLVAGWCWGWAVRTIRGSATVVSNHASGSAADLNAPRHVLGTAASASFSPAQIATIHRLLADFGGAIRWGGDYTGRTDPMHIEVVVSEAACALTLAKLAAPQPAPAPSPVSRGFLMALTDAQQAEILADVRALTGPINRAGDGQTGTTTLAAVAQWSDYHITVTRGMITQLRSEVDAVAAQLAKQQAGPTSGPAVLSDADVDRIAARVVKLIGAKTSA